MHKFLCAWKNPAEWYDRAVPSYVSTDLALAAAKQGNIAGWQELPLSKTTSKNHSFFQWSEMEKSARKETQVYLHPFQCQTTAITSLDRELEWTWAVFITTTKITMLGLKRQSRWKVLAQLTSHKFLAAGTEGQQGLVAQISHFEVRGSNFQLLAPLAAVK